MKKVCIAPFLLIHFVSAFGTPFPLSSRHAKAVPLTKERSLPWLSYRGGDVTHQSANSEADEVVEAVKLALLEVDVEEARIQIAKNWGWILVAGFLNSIGGVMAITLPIVASEVALITLAYSLYTIGAAGVIGAFFSEKGFKIKSLLFGIVNVGLASFMLKDPFDALDMLTIWIGLSTLTEGLFETTFAVRNKNLKQRGWNFLSGVASIAVGVWALFRRPISTLVVPGLALGINLLSTGISKLGIAFYGQDEAIRLMKV